LTEFGLLSAFAPASWFVVAFCVPDWYPPAPPHPAWHEPPPTVWACGCDCDVVEVFVAAAFAVEFDV
jgi:hypothetical protein